MNFYLIGELSDPMGELIWLEQKLREIEEEGRIAIIIGHVPPGSSDCNKAFAGRYRALIDRFQHIVRGQYFGHIHYEEFRIVRASEDNKPIHSEHWTGSLTTFVEGAGKNP